ncbi:MAG: OmpA family protein [Planctomycetaceae bacterium]|nr:OmpA family protein [Planctomycetaceae bacterium]
MADDGPPGVPEWVVTYGDMMSLLLTFFIMLVSLSEVVADKKYRAILEAARQHMGYRSAPLAPPGKKFPMNSLIEDLENQMLGSQADTEKGSGGTKSHGTPGQDLRVMRLDEGESQLAGRAILFQEGSAEISPEMKEQILGIARDIAGKPQKIEIRAFCNPFVAGIPQTTTQLLDLGYERANAIRQILLDQKIRRNHMRVAVFFHSLENETQRNPTGATDRVEITIFNEFAHEYIGREQDYE